MERPLGEQSLVDRLLVERSLSTSTSLVCSSQITTRAMKPQTILVNVILAIVLSAGVLMLIDAGSAPLASKQGTAAQQDSMQRDSTGGGSTSSGSTSSGSTKRGNTNTGTAQPGSTRAPESPSQRPPIADTLPGPVGNGLAGIMGGERPGGQPSELRGPSRAGRSSSSGGSEGRKAIRDAREQTSENLRETLGEPKREGREKTMSIEAFNQRADTLRRQQRDNLEAVIEDS